MNNNIPGFKRKHILPRYGAGGFVTSLTFTYTDKRLRRVGRYITLDTTNPSTAPWLGIKGAMTSGVTANNAIGATNPAAVSVPVVEGALWICGVTQLHQTTTLDTGIMTFNVSYAATYSTPKTLINEDDANANDS